MKLSKFFVLLSIVFVMTAGSVKAQEQELPITIVDLQYIMRESKAAKSIQDQISKMRDKYKKELQEKEEDLKEKEKELIEKRKVLQGEEFEKLRKDFEKDVITVQKQVRGKQVELDRAFSQAMDEVRAEAVKIIAEMAEQRGASLVLPRQNIIIVDQSLDITRDVVSKLDATLDIVDVDVE